MWWIPLAAAAISAAASRNSARESRLATESANTQNAQAQKEFAQQGIRWRVEDAKAAGLHPLYALGASGAAFSPSYQPDYSKANFSQEMGQNLARAAQAMDPTQRELNQAQLEAVRAGAAKDRALADAAASEAARLRQASGAGAVSEVYPLPHLERPTDEASAFGSPYRSVNVRDLPEIPGQFEQAPSYLVSNKAEPGFKKFTLPAVGDVILPNAQNMAEAVEAMENPVIQAAILAANMVHYGHAGIERLKKGLGPEFKWWSDPMGAAVEGARRFAGKRGVQIRR